MIAQRNRPKGFGVVYSAGRRLFGVQASKHCWTEERASGLSRYVCVTDKPTVQETILVVEDDVLVRMPIAQYLRDCGYKVVEAVNADEAIAVLLHQETVVDVVFSDIEMPGSIDGFGLAKWIRELVPV